MSLMMALIASDNRSIRRVKDILIEEQCADLIVSHYTAEEVDNQQFRGVVFNRGLSETGGGIWDRNASASAIVYTGAGGDLTLGYMPDGVEIVSQDDSIDPDFNIRVTRQWLRISSDSNLLHYACSEYTNLIAAGDVDDNLFWTFLRESKAGDRDPLRFGLIALHSASWIYVPNTDGLGDEVYINQDSKETARLLADKRVSSAPQSAFRCFC